MRSPTNCSARCASSRNRAASCSSSAIGSATWWSHCARVAVMRDGRVRTVALRRSADRGEPRPATRDRRRNRSARPLFARPSARPRRPAPVFSRRRWTGAARSTTSTFPLAPDRSSRSWGWRDRARASSCARSRGSSSATGEIALRGATDLDLRRLRAYVPATRALSLYSNFSVGENLLVRLGVPDIAGRLLALRKRHHGERSPQAAVKPLPRQDPDDDHADPLALRRQPAEGGDRAGAQVLAANCCCSRSPRAAWTFIRRTRSIVCCASSPRRAKW